MAELQIRVPYTAWGDGEEWETGYLELMNALHKAVEDGRPGHGQRRRPSSTSSSASTSSATNVRDLASAAREVLVRHKLRDAATGFLTNPDAEDGHRHTGRALTRGYQFPGDAGSGCAASWMTYAVPPEPPSQTDSNCARS